MLDPRFDPRSAAKPTFAPAHPSTSAPARAACRTPGAGRRAMRAPSLRSGTTRIAAVTAVTATLAGLLFGLTARTATAAPSTSSLRYRAVHSMPRGDSFVASGWPRARFGKRLHIAVGIRRHNRRTAYLRFQVPAGGTVVGARLTLTRLGYWSPQYVSARLAVSSGWNEWSLDARRAPRIGRWLDTERVTRKRRAVTFDVADAFRYRRRATIAIIAPNRRGLVQFASRQAPFGQPRLTVTIAYGVRSPEGSTPPPSSSPAPPSGSSTDPTSPEPTSTNPTSTDPTSTAPTSPDPTSTAPTSPDPTTPDPTSPAPTSSSPSGGGCHVSAILVPSCGRWWGIAADQFDWSMPADQAVAQAEQVAGRPYDIVHFYHTNSSKFPTAAERAIATQPSRNRLLLINWKPSTSLTWAQVAAGKADATIDAEAQYLHDNWTEPFFLAIYHEPEDNVVPSAGSGMTAADYAAMYRHVVLRLRADGVSNAVTVMDYMGYFKWEKQSWFNQLWPGNDVVDWIGLDPYGTGSASDTFSAHDLNKLINRQDMGVPGYYDWATQTHPGKPIMLCEWGVSYDPNSPTGQVPFFDSLATEVTSYPWLKALVYYDVPKQTSGLPWTSVTQNDLAEAAYRRASNAGPFVAPHWSY